MKLLRKSIDKNKYIRNHDEPQAVDHCHCGLTIINNAVIRVLFFK